MLTRSSVLALLLAAHAHAADRISAGAEGGLRLEVRAVRSVLGDALLDADTPARARDVLEQNCPPCVLVAETASRWNWLPGALFWPEGSAIVARPSVRLWTAAGDTVEVERVVVFRGPQEGEDRFFMAQVPAVLAPGWHMPPGRRDWCGVGLLLAVPARFDYGDLAGMVWHNGTR